MKALDKERRLVIIATTFGNIIEWYEFGLYIYLAPIIIKLFFNDSSSISNMVNGLLIFAIGFLSRPLGGLLFGYIGDRFGRKTAIMTSITCITLPTFLVGILPTYAQIGVLASTFLAITRFLQGIPVGGEFPGTICYLIENAEPKQTAFFGSWAFFGSQIGSLLNIVECVLFTKYLSHEQLLSWGWRLSFIVGGLIGLLGLFLRHKLKETPIYERLKTHEEIVQSPIRQSFRHYKSKMFKGFLVSALPLAGYYMIFVFIPFYFQQFLQTSFIQSMIINGSLLLLSTILLPLYGRLADKYNKRKILIWSAAAIIFFSYPLYISFDRSSVILLISIEIILVILLSIHFALIPDTLAPLFPSSVRFTCVAFSYNMCNSLLAGASPFVSLYLMQETRSPTIPSIMLIVFSLLTIYGVMRKR
ncbi:MAG: MFS transporter [Chlamydiales bacterium]|nr:MFS transporter [Chlamydiales bacterium]